MAGVLAARVPLELHCLLLSFSACSFSIEQQVAALRRTSRGAASRFGSSSCRRCPQKWLAAAELAASLSRRHFRTCQLAAFHGDNLSSIVCVCVDRIFAIGYYLPPPLLRPQTSLRAQKVSLRGNRPAECKRAPFVCLSFCPARAHTHTHTTRKLLLCGAFRGRNSQQQLSGQTAQPNRQSVSDLDVSLNVSRGD